MAHPHSLALYTEACTVVRTDVGLSKSFEVKVGLHQGFAVVSREVVCLISYCILMT